MLLFFYNLLVFCMCNKQQEAVTIFFSPWWQWDVFEYSSFQLLYQLQVPLWLESTCRLYQYYEILQFKRPMSFLFFSSIEFLGKTFHELQSPYFIIFTHFNLNVINSWILFQSVTKKVITQNASIFPPPFRITQGLICFSRNVPLTGPIVRQSI